MSQGADWLAEVYIGRVPVSTPQEMANWIAKLHKDQERATNNRRSGEMLLIGSHLGLGGKSNWSKPQLEQIRLGGSWGGVETLGLSERTGLPIDTLYDSDRLFPQYMGQDIRDQLNGKDYVALHFLGHGMPEAAAKLEPKHIDGLTNATPFFAYICSCRSGDFGRNGPAGRLLSAVHGAVGVVAYSWVAVIPADCVDNYCQLLSRYFWDSALVHPNWPVGVLNAASHERSAWLLWHRAQQTVIFASNLLGDPAMMLALPTK